MKSTLASRQLRAFAIVAKRRSYTRAARDLSVTQSTLSHAIQTLERTLGVQLLAIIAGDMQLTSSGRKILPHARKILGEMKKIQGHAARDSRVGAARPPRFQRAA